MRGRYLRLTVGAAILALSLAAGTCLGTLHGRHTQQVDSERLERAIQQLREQAEALGRSEEEIARLVKDLKLHYKAQETDDGSQTDNEGHGQPHQDRP